MATIGNDISIAANILRESGVVAIPTETVYGLAGNAYDPVAVSHIFSVKNRPSFDPLIVHTNNASVIQEFTEGVPPTLQLLAQRFWPGPLTLLLPKKDIIPDLVTSGLERVAVRIPEHPLTRSLLEELEFPLVAPSANPFGYVSPTSAGHVEKQLGDKIPYILDGGDCEVGIESTIVGLDGEEPVIYRLGGISLEKIESIIGKVRVLPPTSSPETPGMMKSHYSPVKNMILGDLDLLTEEHVGKKFGILSLTRTFSSIPESAQRQLSAEGDLEIAAQNLFSCLRYLDQIDVEFILAEEVPDKGIGRAINDRLRRASIN